MLESRVCPARALSIACKRECRSSLTVFQDLPWCSSCTLFVLPLGFFTFQRTLFMVVFLVEQQHYLSVAVPSMRASVLISFFFLRRGTSLPLPFSFPFLSYANELHRGNELLGKRGWGGGGGGGGAELRHILAFRVPPSHAFRVRFERPTRQEGSEFTQIRPGFREVCHIT